MFIICVLDSIICVLDFFLRTRFSSTQKFLLSIKDVCVLDFWQCLIDFFVRVLNFWLCILVTAEASTRSLRSWKKN